MKFLPSHPILRPLVLLILIAIALFLARLAIGIGSAAIHYAGTPDFPTFISEAPVSEETIAKAFNEAEILTESGPFLSGDLDPASLQSSESDFVETSRTVEITLDHGTEPLLRFSQTFSQAIDKETWARHGFRVDPPRIVSHPGLRVVSDARVFDLEKMFDPDQPGRGGIILNVVLAAGQGADLSRITSGEHHSVTRIESSEFGGSLLLSGQKPSFPFWRVVTGITHNLEDLPEEGLMHQFQLVVRFDRIKVDGGSQGPSSHFPQHAVTTEEYSYSWKVTQQNGRNGEEQGSSTSSKAMTREWNDAVW